MDKEETGRGEESACKRVWAFATTMDERTAEDVARRKGAILWRMVFAKLPLAEIRLRYVEYLIVEVSITYKETFISRFRERRRGTLDRNPGLQEKKIILICNGTSGSASVVESFPEIEYLEFDEDLYEDMVQESDFSEDHMVSNAKKLTNRIMHRLVGGFPRIVGHTTRRIFRPFYVALYGEVKDGAKVRYITIPADGGYTTKRGEFL